MESSFSTININDDDDQAKMVEQPSKLLNTEDDLAVTAKSSKSSSPFNLTKQQQSTPSQDIISISSKSPSIRNDTKIETDLSKTNENFYQTFSSLIMDQLNIPDVNALLDSQRNM